MRLTWMTLKAYMRYQLLTDAANRLPKRYDDGEL